MKSVKVAVSAAVSMAFRQMHREFEAVEDMKKEAVKVNEEMTRLRARVQTALRPGSTRTVQSMRIGSTEFQSVEGDATKEDNNEIVLKIATQITADTGP